MTLPVGLFTDRLFRDGRATGVGGYVAGVARALAKLDALDYEVIALSEPGGPHERFEGLPVRYIPGPRAAVQAGWLVFRRPLIGRYGPRVRLVHNLVPTIPTPSAVPLIVTVHDLMPIQNPESFSRKSRRAYSAAIAHTIKHASHITSDSHATRDVLISFGVAPERITTVYPGRPFHFRPVSEAIGAGILAGLGLEHRRYFLFLGEVAERKMPLLLAKAFSDFAGRHSEIQLIYAGSPGRGAADVAEAAARSKASSRIRMLGHVSADVSAALMQSATALVLPSAQEGFGLPVLEAMSVGTPVIVSDAGALPEVTGDAGLVAPRGDREALASAMEQIVGDEGLAAELSERGLRRAKTFSWDRTAQQLRELYARYD